MSDVKYISALMLVLCAQIALLPYIHPLYLLIMSTLGIIKIFTLMRTPYNLPIIPQIPQYIKTDILHCE